MKLHRLLPVGALACGVALSAVAQTSAPSGITQPKGEASSSTKSTTKSNWMAKIDQRNALHVKNGQTRKQTFDAIDSNRDGYISHAEAGAIPSLIVIWSQADTNADDRLSPAEFNAVPIVQADGSSVR